MTDRFLNNILCKGKETKQYAVCFRRFIYSIVFSERIRLPEKVNRRICWAQRFTFLLFRMRRIV